MNMSRFQAKMETFVRYIAPNRSADEIRNLYPCIFVNASYPISAVRCNFQSGWSNLENEDSYFDRGWRNGDIDFPDEVTEAEAREIVSKWGFSLDDGLHMLAKAHWTFAWSDRSSMDNAEYYIATYGFPVTPTELFAAEREFANPD